MLPVFLHAPSVVSKSVSASLTFFVLFSATALSVRRDFPIAVFSLPYVLHGYFVFPNLKSANSACSDAVFPRANGECRPGVSSDRAT